MIKFHCLTFLTSWDILQYVYCNYLFSSLWRHEFEINPQDKNLNILRRKRVFKMKWKELFIIFKGLSVARNCLRFENALYNLTFTAYTQTLARTEKHVQKCMEKLFGKVFSNIFCNILQSVFCFYKAFKSLFVKKAIITNTIVSVKGFYY